MSAYTGRSRSFLTDNLDHFPDTGWVEDGISVHPSEKVDCFQTVSNKELGETIEELRGEHCQGFFMTTIEVVEQTSDEDQRVAFPLILVFDNADIGDPFVEAFLDGNRHLWMLVYGIRWGYIKGISSDVGLLVCPSLIAGENIL